MVFCLCFLLTFTMSSATCVLLERQVDVFLGRATDSRSDSLHTEPSSAVSVTRLFSLPLSHKCCHSLPPLLTHHSAVARSPTTPHHTTGLILWHAIEAIGEPAHTRQTPTQCVLHSSRIISYAFSTRSISQVTYTRGSMAFPTNPMWIISFFP